MAGGLQPEPGTALYTLFGLVFPIVGVVISCAFSLSPLPRLVRINKDNDLHGYDPLPPTLNLGSGVAWVLYRFVSLSLSLSLCHGRGMRMWAGEGGMSHECTLI